MEKQIGEAILGGHLDNGDVPCGECGECDTVEYHREAFDAHKHEDLLESCAPWKSYAQLAWYCLGELWKLQVCKSGAGWYIGVIDPQQGPLSRESQDYFGSEQEARKLLATGMWMQKPTP